MSEIIKHKDASFHCGDVTDILPTLPTKRYQMCVTAPPSYAARDYGDPKQIGKESTIEGYIEKLVSVFREVKRVLKDDGILWVNMNNIYASSGLDGNIVRSNKEKNYDPKDLIGIPWMFAFALQNDGWILRSEIIWEQTNCRPTPVRDRCTDSHEHIFMFSKKNQYHYDKKAILEPLKYSPHAPKNKSGNINPDRIWGTDDGKNRRSVWSGPTQQVSGVHFPTLSLEIAKSTILAGSKEGDMILDIFSGAGTVSVEALSNKRGFCGIELVKENIDISINRINETEKQTMKDLF